MFVSYIIIFLKEVEMDSEKSRLTLWMDKNVKTELKNQARENGVSASAYISMLVMERAKEAKKS